MLRERSEIIEGGDGPTWVEATRLDWRAVDRALRDIALRASALNPCRREAWRTLLLRQGTPVRASAPLPCAALSSRDQRLLIHVDIRAAALDQPARTWLIRTLFSSGTALKILSLIHI